MNPAANELPLKLDYGSASRRCSLLLKIIPFLEYKRPRSKVRKKKKAQKKFRKENLPFDQQPSNLGSRKSTVGGFIVRFLRCIFCNKNCRNWNFVLSEKFYTDV